jgi:hypothetical protein
MPEKFTPVSTDKKWNQGIDDFRKSKAEKDSSSAKESHYSRNQEEIDKEFGKNQETDYFDDEQKDNSNNNQTKGSKQLTAQGNQRDRVKELYVNNQEKINKEFGNEEKNEKIEEKTVEELRKEADEAFQKVLIAEEDFGKIKNNMGIFRKTQALFGLGKNKDGHISKEFKEKKQLIEDLNKEYRVKFNEFARKLENDERAKMKNDGRNEAEIQELIGLWALGDPAISVKEKQEDNTEKEEKFSVFQYINRNEKKILEKRMEILSQKEKGIITRNLERYSKLSKTKKLIIGGALSSAVGAGVVLGGGAALSTALGYGAWRGGKAILRRLLVGSISGTAINMMNEGLKRRSENKKVDDFENAKLNFAEKFKDLKQDVFGVLDQYNKKITKRDRNRKIAVGVTAGALFGTAIGLEGFLAGNGGVDLDLKEFSGKSDYDYDLKKSHGDEIYETGNSRPEAVDRKAMYDRMDEDSVERYRDRVDRRMAYNNLKDGMESGGSGEGGLDNFREDIASKVNEDKNFKSVFEAEKLNHSFELAKGGNVWNSLSEHFGGDRQEVAKVLAGFRAEAMKDLMENHGMSEVRANQFIEWRYRHMDIGAEFELKNGKLEIPGFDSDKKIAQFGKTEFNNPDSMNDTMENAGKNRSEREIFRPTPREEFFDKKSVPPPPRESLDISEPIETTRKFPSEISDKINQNIDNLVNDIYGRQAYEWDVMKDKNAWDVINGEYGNPIKADYGSGFTMEGRKGVPVGEIIESERGAVNNNALDQAEINNRKALNQYLVNLMNESGIKPRPNETVDNFMFRVAEEEYMKNISENVPSGIKVEDVPDPDSFEAPEKTNLSNDLANAPERLVGWDGLKNVESWEVLNSGDELTRNHLKDLIISSNSIPVEGESLEEFHNRALERINGNIRIPQTELENGLNKVFGEWDRNKIDQWLKMKEYKADVIYNKNLLDLNLTDKEQMAFSSMKAYLQELSRVSEIKPDSGESLASYIEKAQKSLKV